MKDRIERNGRVYTYSESDDTWYPLPTEREYRFQVRVIWASAVILLLFVVYSYLTH